MHENLLYLFSWLAAASLLGILVTLIALPLVLLRLPADYFTDERHRHGVKSTSMATWLLVAFKNLAGLVLLVAGVLMLVLPGQGLLTMLGGILLMNFPGKYRFERRLMLLPRVAAAINWVRMKGGKPPFLTHDEKERL